MTRAGALLAVQLFVAPAHAQVTAPVSGFNTALASRIFSVALAFMAPRILDPVPVSQLAQWGLHGLSALDPLLSTQARDGGLVLLDGDRVLIDRPLPSSDDAGAWGSASAELYAAAWNQSSAIRRVGAQGAVQSFFDEVFNHLDPYSRYVPPTEAAEDRASRSGTAGAGLVLVARGRTIAVQEAVEGGPAAEQGIRPGDVIVSVDGRPTLGETVETVSGWIAGLEDTELTLAWKARDGRLHLATLTRAVVPPETVYAQRNGTMLVLRITGFDRSTSEHLAGGISEALASKRKPDGIVLDLRGNRGGLLRQTVQAADIFLNAGLVALTVGRDPQASRLWQSADGELAEHVPLIVLVDGRTASSAEILAAALADRGRAVVVGSSTLGKGLVQTITQLPDGGELFVTWSRVLAPRGWPIQGLGVLPQVCTSLGEDALVRQLADLDRGVAPMAEAIARRQQARAPLPAAQILAIRSACPAAEGRDSDVAVARYLLNHPAAYVSALLPPVEQSAPAQPGPALAEEPGRP